MAHLFATNQRIYLLIIGCPNTARDETAFEVEHWGPVALTSDRTDQHKTVFVADEGHLTVMRPLKVGHLNKQTLNITSMLPGEHQTVNLRWVLQAKSAEPITEYSLVAVRCQ